MSSISVDAWSVFLTSGGLAFIGALFGGCFSFFFARRSAQEQAIGQQWALRRIELIERLAHFLDEVERNMAIQDGAPYLTVEKDMAKLAIDFNTALVQARMYVSDRLIADLRRYAHWVEEHVTEGCSIVKTTVPDNLDHGRTTTLLKEALEGRQLPWTRWWHKWTRG